MHWLIVLPSFTFLDRILDRVMLQSELKIMVHSISAWHTILENHFRLLQALDCIWAQCSKSINQWFTLECARFCIRSSKYKPFFLYSNTPSAYGVSLNMHLPFKSAVFSSFLLSACEQWNDFWSAKKKRKGDVCMQSHWLCWFKW